MGLDRVADGQAADGLDDVFGNYLRAKLAAKDDLKGRDLRWTIVRPSMLTDEQSTGKVRLETSANAGSVPRADVAAVLAEIIATDHGDRQTVELVSGATSAQEAVSRL